MNSLSLKAISIIYAQKKKKQHNFVWFWPDFMRIIIYAPTIANQAGWRKYPKHNYINPLTTLNINNNSHLLNLQKCSIIQTKICAVPIETAI